MMGRLEGQEQLFYAFRLEEHVPADHLLRRIDAALDLSFVRERLATTYSRIGRPSVDPELTVRMLLVGYLFGIRSERRLARWRARGDVSPGSLRGRIRSPLHPHRQWLLDQVEATPGLTLAELREQLAAEHGLVAGIAAIWSFFKREGVSLKNAAALLAGQARRRAPAGELAALRL